MGGDELNKTYQGLATNGEKLVEVINVLGDLHSFIVLALVQANDAKDASELALQSLARLSRAQA